MLTINQISFATFSFLAFFLGLKACMERNKFELTKTQNSYWLKSVTAFFTTNVSFLVGSFDFSVFILIANTSIMFYSSNLFLLLRSFRQSVEEELLFLSKILLVTFSAEFLVLLLFDIPYSARYILVGGTLCVITCLQIREIIRLIKINSSIYLKLIGLALGFILILFADSTPKCNSFL